MKRIMAMLLAIGMLFSFAACQKSGINTEVESTESVTSTETLTDDMTSDMTEDTNSKDESETTESEVSTTETTENVTSEDNIQTVKPYSLVNTNTVLLDSNGVKLTALDFSEEISDTYVLIDVRVENSNTHDVNIFLNSLIVNGYMVSGRLDDLITEAGTDDIFTLNISKRDIEFAEIDEIREVIVSFYVKDENYKLFISPVEPVSLKTTLFDSPAKELDTSGVEVYNENGIQIVVKEELESDSRYMLGKLIIKNFSDTGISVGCDKLLVNGKEMPYSNCIRYGRVPSGLISYNSMDLEKSALKDLGVEEIETIEMTFKVISDDYILIAGDLNVTVNYK